MTGASTSQGSAPVLCHLWKLCQGCRYAHLACVSRLCVSSGYQKLKSVLCVPQLKWLALMPVSCSVQTKERHKQLCGQAGPSTNIHMEKKIPSSIRQAPKQHYCSHPQEASCPGTLHQQHFCPGCRQTGNKPVVPLFQACSIP